LTSPGDDGGRRLLYRGAEADLFEGRWQGQRAVYKVRKPLKYRLEALDVSIRRQRTVHEAEAIGSAKKAGVLAPFLYFVDPKNTSIVMEYVEGTRLKEVADSAPDDKVAKAFALLGREVARLHSHGIMHGDLTTANLVARGEDLVFLDFGLALRTRRLEDHAVDLRLIKETLVGAHPRVAPFAMESLRRGYESAAGKDRTRDVFRQLVGIERRGRYARVD